MVEGRDRPTLKHKPLTGIDPWVLPKTWGQGGGSSNRGSMGGMRGESYAVAGEGKGGWVMLSWTHQGQGASGLVLGRSRTSVSQDMP